MNFIMICFFIHQQLPEMSEMDRFEVLYLVKLAMDVVQPKDIRDYQGKVKEHLDKGIQIFIQGSNSHTILR